MVMWVTMESEGSPVRALVRLGQSILVHVTARSECCPGDESYGVGTNTVSNSDESEIKALRHEARAWLQRG